MALSLLRRLIPFSVKGAGPVARILSATFMNQPLLLGQVMQALESTPTAEPPRAAFAKLMHQLMEGQTEQRDLRPAFDLIDTALRLDLLNSTGPAEFDPLYRLLTYELRAASVWYSRMLGISAAPQNGAWVSLRSLILSDVRTDKLLIDVFLAFEDPVRRPLMPEAFRAFVREMMVLERNAFGEHRFDGRGEHSHFLHCLTLRDVGMSAQSAAILEDEDIQAFGNFVLESENVSPRWRECRLSCGPEEHRALPDLPAWESVRITGEGWQHDIRVFYNEPLLPRQLPPHSPLTTPKHVEVFQLPISDSNRTFLEKFFLDR